MRYEEQHNGNGPTAQEPQGRLQRIEENLASIQENLAIIAKAQEDTLRYLREIERYLFPYTICADTDYHENGKA